MRGLTAEEARSRSLLAHAARSFDHETDVALLKDINRLSSIQSIVGLRKEIHDRPRIGCRQCLADGSKTIDDCAVLIELQRWITTPIARTRYCQQASFLHPFVDCLTRNAAHQNSDL